MPVEDPGGGVETAGPDRQTRVIGGDGTDTLSYSLAPGLFQYVESVRAVIDNTGGGDAQAELEVATANGVVIATQKQDDAIPAGDTGGATFALRLAAKPSARGFIKWGNNTAPGSLGLNLDGGGDPWTFQTFGGAFAFNTGGGAYDVNSGGNGTTFDTDGGGFDAHTDGGNVVLDSNGGDVSLYSSNGLLEVDAFGGDARFQASNDVAQVVAHGADGSLDITGTPITMSPAVVVNLAAGQSFVVNDGGGNPIFTLTG